MTTNYFSTISEALRLAKAELGAATTHQKNRALKAIAETIDHRRSTIKAQNAKDFEAGEAKGLSPALLDRLTLTDERIDAMVESALQVAALPDPVGTINDVHPQPSGIHVGQMRVPIGIVGIIYESRPNVTIEAACLCLKSGNVAVLRGGSEAAASNQALADCIRIGVKAANLSSESIHVVNTTDREVVKHMLHASDLIDVIIPRGGKGLIEMVTAEAKVPVIKHLDGVCHVYVDESADMERALSIAVNAKTHRYGVCNAMETLLVHASIAPSFLPAFQSRALEADADLELRGCSDCRTYLTDIQPASASDWTEEYLGPILAIRVVDSLDQAIVHINQYGSHHTDSIVTDNYERTQRFIREVDSSSVMTNASTRFADGFEYGLGAEIGISTNKLHARGPVGLIGLTTQKYVVYGHGEIRGG